MSYKTILNPLTSEGFNLIPNTAKVVFVSNINDFPAPVTGVITLVSGTTYVICQAIDLVGNRLSVVGSTAIVGLSSETASLTSTGLGAGVPLITSVSTTSIQEISITDVNTAISINGGGTAALDWIGVNFVNVPNVGTIQNVDNFIFARGSLLNSKGLTFKGAVNTIGISNSLLRGNGTAGNIIKIDPTCVVSRRFRIIYSSIVAFGSTVGLNVDLLATIPTEAYILDTINFSGGATYLSGVTQTSNKTLFVNCVGIVNTSVNGQVYMKGNAVATSVAATNTWYKVAGVTTPSPDNSKYTTLIDNRLTNDAVIQRKYLIQCNLSFTAGANNVCEFGFYDSKLGTIRTPSITPATANAGGRAENVSFACVVQHAIGNYLEIWTQNTTAIQDITVTDENFIITEIK